LTEKTGVNSPLLIAPKTQDFVSEAAVSDMTEIAAADIALQKGDADEKQFADQMVKNPTQTSTELKALVSGGDVQATLPTVPDSASQKLIDKLNAAAPADFRSEYDSSQVSTHKSAVSLFERYAKGGDNAKLKDWAQKTLPHLQHHLEMANMLDQRRSNCTRLGKVLKGQAFIQRDPSLYPVLGCPSGCPGRLAWRSTSRPSGARARRSPSPTKKRTCYSAWRSRSISGNGRSSSPLLRPSSRPADKPTRSGLGSVHRVARTVQRRFFDPPALPQASPVHRGSAA
jgi:putative membrane protein